MYLLNSSHINKKDVQNVFYHFCDVCFIKKNLADFPTLFYSDATLILDDKIIKGVGNVVQELLISLPHIDENFTFDELNINQFTTNSSFISSLIRFDKKELYCTFLLTLKNDWKISHLHITSSDKKMNTAPNIDVEMIKTKELKELNERIARLEVAASSDFLTGLYNRYKFTEILASEFEYSVINKIPLSVIYLDIDNFKLINDRYGHLIGDQLILATSKIIKNYLNGEVIAARWGGDEFVIMAPSYSINEAINLANEIRSDLEKSENYSYITVTASFGVAQYEHGDTPEIFLNKADLALYKAKRKGKNRVEC